MKEWGKEKSSQINLKEGARQEAAYQTRRRSIRFNPTETRATTQPEESITRLQRLAGNPLRRAYGKNYHTYVMDYFSDNNLSYFDW